MTGGWFIADSGPHNYNNHSDRFVKETTGMYNQITTVWSRSNLSTINSIDFTNYSELCFSLVYYIPEQENTGQGIYYGILYNSYNFAIKASYLEETTELTETTICLDVRDANYIGYPFIEIYNGHTMSPYDGWIANTYLYLKRVYLH